MVRQEHRRAEPPGGPSQGGHRRTRPRRAARARPPCVGRIRGARRRTRPRRPARRLRRRAAAPRSSVSYDEPAPRGTPDPTPARPSPPPAAVAPWCPRWRGRPRRPLHRGIARGIAARSELPGPGRAATLSRPVPGRSPLAGAASRRAQSMNVGQAGNAVDRQYAAVGQRPRRRRRLGEAAMAMIRDGQAIVAVVVQRDERADRGAFGAAREAISHRGDDTRTGPPDPWDERATVGGPPPAEICRRSYTRCATNPVAQPRPALPDRRGRPHPGANAPRRGVRCPD